MNRCMNIWNLKLGVLIGLIVCFLNSSDVYAEEWNQEAWLAALSKDTRVALLVYNDRNHEMPLLESNMPLLESPVPILESKMPILESLMPILKSMPS